MAGLIAIKHLGNRQEEYVTISADMLREVEGFTVKFKVGDTVKVKDILYGLICGGGNDAALIIAHLCSGGVESFISEMNNEAKSIGMTNTIYKNPTGIDETGMVTTIKDTAILSMRAISTPLFVELSSPTEYKYTIIDTNEERTIANRNALISNYSAIGYTNKYVKGLNSGMTTGGGYCVSAYATNGNDEYLCIVMGGEITSSGKITAYTVANSLINHAFNNFEYVKIASAGDVVGTIPVELALPTNGNQAVVINCVFKNDVYTYAPKNIDYKKELTYKTYFYQEILRAPVNDSTVVGVVEIFYGNELLAEADLITSGTISESKLLVALKEMKNIILSRFTLIFIIILSLLLSIYFYFSYFKKKIKKRRKRSFSKSNIYK